MKKFITYIIVIGVLCSCEKVIPFTGDVTQPKLVVNSLFDAENPWNVNVSQSLSVIDTGTLSYVENAVVLIKDNQDNIVETLYYDSNWSYSGNLYPQVGQEYRVEVTADGFTPVSAVNNLPSPITIPNVDTATTTINNEQRFEMSVTINDPAGVSNYYLISVHAGGWFDEEIWNGSFWEFDSSFYDFAVPILVNDPIFENYGSDRWENKGIFTDFSFDGQSRTIDIAIGIDDLGEKFSDLDFLEVRIFNITEAAYLYNKSYDLYQNASGNPFAQPVQVYSNITEGFGLFAGQQLNVFSIL